MKSRSTDPRPTAAGEVREVVEHLFRQRAGQLKATLGRIFGLAHLDLVEDVVQEALVTALRRWPHSGIPDNPSAWLIQVARHRALDAIRRSGTWRDKEGELRHRLASLAAAGDAGNAEAGFAGELADDQLRMIFACCHPELRRDAQVALTLKVVGGFGVDEIARAFLSRKATVAQRLVRAKRRLRERGIELEIPPPELLPERLDAVLEMVYLLFNEGYSATGGEVLVRHDLCREAIRLILLLAASPTTAAPRIDALAALFLLQGARLPARVDRTGLPVRLADQDRRRWDRAMMARGIHHLARAGRGDAVSRYHFEAEIAAFHGAAERPEDTDWAHILGCYDRLLRLQPSPIVELNRAVALAEVVGPTAALAIVDRLAADPALGEYPLLWATRADLLTRLERPGEAAGDLARARRLVASAPAHRLLERRFAEASAG